MNDYQAHIFQNLGQIQLLRIVELVARQITEPDYYAHYVADEMLKYPLSHLPQVVFSYCDSLESELDKLLFLQRLINVLVSEAITGKVRPKDFNDEYDP
ncbi:MULTISPECIES: hypothetical protein [unclassified Nostoc]|uniref:hypothetical protein n=1 Tax=unclassified Nostoc TaxID=2593658 RepID=UPI002AD1F822|nr:hypothetical protein [Nostoc sp. DedQUE03]MDZ7974048.1 hypothetical protein [Nostoc sp. DedQUE03]MDZ8048549.1 hypothetical protein [Nostoc sp. DedQUE02]